MLCAVTSRGSSVPWLPYATVVPKSASVSPGSFVVHAIVAMVGETDVTRTAVIVTSNVAFEQWGRIFGGDEMIAAAILDRLLHHSQVFLISGPSYRLKGKLVAREPPPVTDETR